MSFSGVLDGGMGYGDTCIFDGESGTVTLVTLQDFYRSGPLASVGRNLLGDTDRMLYGMSDKTGASYWRPSGDAARRSNKMPVQIPVLHVTKIEITPEA